jgi:hypothetical protein
MIYIRISSLLQQYGIPNTPGNSRLYSTLPNLGLIKTKKLGHRMTGYEQKSINEVFKYIGDVSHTSLSNNLYTATELITIKDPNGRWSTQQVGVLCSVGLLRFKQKARTRYICMDSYSNLLKWYTTQQELILSIPENDKYVLK